MAVTIVDTALVKRHLRIDFDDDDDTIGAYQSAAESIVSEYLDRKILASGEPLPEPDEAGYDQFTMNTTPAVTAAILLLVGELYENREADPESNLTVDRNSVLPRAVRMLLAPWRVWRTLDEGNCNGSAKEPQY